MKGSKLSQIAIKYIEKAYDGYVVNVVISGKSGIPDLLACINGKFFAFEIKGKDDQEKDIQDENLNRVQKAGGYGGYVRSLADIDYIVNNHKKFKLKIDTKKISL